MSNEELIDWLTERGYVQYPDRLHEWAFWSGSRRMPAGTPECLTNEQKIAWHVRLYDYTTSAGPHCSAEVEIVGHSGRDIWCNLKVYGLGFSELREKLDEIEQRLAAAWRAFGEEPGRG